MNKSVLDLIKSRGTSLKLAKGSPVFSEGDSCYNFIIVLSGSVKVYKLSEKGSEITLYRVNSDNLCVLTSTCILSASTYPASAVTEDEVTSIVLNKKSFDDLILESEEFRHHVFASLSSRFTTFVQKIDEVMFHTTGERLLEFLKSFKDQDGIVSMTHQNMANELGTERETISRLLKSFESKGIVKNSRGSVQVL